MLDPNPPWGTLIKLQALATHFIHQVWHILPSLSPQTFADVSNGPFGLSPLDTEVINWEISKDGICLLQLFGGISFALVVIMYYKILIYRYHYVGKDLQARQTFVQHVMML
jgi:hypothetical protein